MGINKKDFKVVGVLAVLLFLSGISAAPPGESTSAEGKYIVVLEEPSMAEAASRGLSVRSHKARLQQSHRDFLQDLERVSNGRKMVRHEYTRVFNGFALQGVSKQELRKIRSLPGVKEVRKDRKYEIKLDDSVPLIGANKTWKKQVNGSNLTGKGVKVAILDTGVMFNHSDLGDCTVEEYNGTGCDRFTAGYDVVNNDFIPTDNHGHGTHVAGIIGANGSVKGVAPGVTFMAYKICGGGGSCYSSDIIEGIQRAVNDGADVISLSVGGGGNPDDSNSEAIDNAVENGTLAVVAAGNSGPSYYTVNSPGTARKALTVGATDKSDNIASYSSRGPVTWNNNIIGKPDIVAPGSNICSTSINTGGCKAGYYEAMSGTSMATPHVSGAAAIVIQSNPGWKPVEVKSALMGSAKNLGYDAFTQGAGRLDVFRAEQKVVVTEPTNLDFGNVTFNRSKEMSLGVKNLGGEPVSVSLGVTNATRFKISRDSDIASLNNTAFNLAPGASEAVGVTLDLNGMNGTFYGYVNITTNTSQGSHLVPFAFARTGMAPTINGTYPSSKLYTSRGNITANLSIEGYYANTTATLDVNGATSVLWNDSDQTAASTNIDLLQGTNFVNFTVYNPDFPAENSTRGFKVVSDPDSPGYDVVIQNTSVVESPGPVKFDVNVSDAVALGEIYLLTNASGVWTPVKQQTGATSCSKQWGADCSVKPGNGEIDNTYTACATGEQTDEHVREIYLDKEVVEPGKPVEITVDFHVWGSSDEEYIWVNTPSGSWEQVWNGTLSGGDHNVTVSFTPKEPGEHIVRGIIDYTGENDYCGSGNYYDNDDVKFRATKGYLLDGKNASSTLRWNTPEFNDTLYWKMNVTDRAGNYATTSGDVEQNDDPAITGYSLRNGSMMTASVIDQGSRAVFTVNVTDPNNDTGSVNLEYKEPGNSFIGAMTRISSGTYQSNVTTASVGGKAWLNITATDSLGRNDTISRSFEVREYQPPRVNESSTVYAEILPNESITISADLSDNYVMSSAVLSTNESGTWKNHSVYGSPVFLTGNGTVEFNWSNSSVNGDVYWRVWANDTFNNWNASSVRKFEVVEFNTSIPVVTVNQDYVFFTEVPGWIKINRSDINWSHTFRSQAVWRALNPVYTKDFENGITGKWTSQGWNLSETAHNGSKSAYSGNVSDNQTSHLNFTYTPQKDSILVFRYMVSSYDDFLVFRVNGEKVWSDSLVTEWRRGHYLMTAGQTYNFSWSYRRDADGSYFEDVAYIDTVKIGTPEKDARASVHPMNHGNYTVKMFENSSNRMLDTYKTGLKANATPKVLTTLNYEDIAVEGINFTLSASTGIGELGSAELRVFNQTGSWNLSSNYSTAVDPETYYRTGEPFNYTTLRINFSGLDNGNYTVEANLTSESGVEKTSRVNFTVFPAKNLTVNISRERNVYVFANTAGFSLNPEYSLTGRWTVNGFASRSIADISIWGLTYNLMILNNRSGTPFTFWGYHNTTLNTSVELDPVYREKAKELEDKKLVAESLQDYDGGKAVTFYGVYNTSRLGISKPSEYMIYSCKDYDRSSNECASSWTQSNELLREKDNGLIGLRVTASSAEAFALGKPVSQDSDSGSSSPPPSFGGGFSSPDPETTVTGGENVTVWNLDLDNKEKEFDVPDNVLGLEGLTVSATGTIEDATLSILSSTASRDDMVVYRAWSIEAPANVSQVNLEFSVPVEWLEQHNFTRDELEFYTGSWSGLPISVSGNESLRYSTSTAPGKVVLAAEVLTCEDVSCSAVSGDTCKTFSSPREVPSGWSTVESCEQWEQKQQAREIIETLEEKVDQPEAREKLQQAKQQYDQGNYSAAVEHAQAANRIENSSSSSIPVMIVAVLGGILILGLGAFLGYRMWRRSIMREDLAELARVLKDEMQAGRLPRDPQILRHINDAREAVERNDYERARKELDRLKNYMAPEP